MVGIEGHPKMKRCPYCQSHNVRRSHRKNWGESALSAVGVYPFRCQNCYGRFRRLETRLTSVISLVVKMVGW